MPDDPGIWYWGAALANMALLVGFAFAGVWRARRRDFARHRRLVFVSAGLVVAFLVSYPLKLAWLGREALSSWSPERVALLRFHESCVLVMLVAGGYALTSALRLGLPLAKFPAGADAADLSRRIARHRLAGRICLGAMALGLGSALGVFAGML